MRLFFAAVLLCTTSPLVAKIATPERPIADPKSLESPVNPDARPVPLADIGNSRSPGSVSWSADGKHVYLSTNLSGRFNIWRTEADGSWPLQMTQSDESQSNPAPTSDGNWLFFVQDKGGDEYYDIFRVPTRGGAVEQLTATSELSERGLRPGPGNGLMALVVKKKSEAQSNLAVIDMAGKVRVLTSEADPQFEWTSAAWTDGGKAIIANRDRVDSAMSEIWRVDVASGKATLILSKKDTIYRAQDISPDGRWLAVSTNDGTGQIHAGLYDIGAKEWKWLKPTLWEQFANRFTRDGKALIVENSDDVRTKLIRYDLSSGAETALALPAGLNFLTGSDPRSPDGKSLLFIHQGANTPANLYAYDLTQDKSRPLTQLALASLTPQVLARSEAVTYKSFDGTLISAVVTMPANLQRNGKNPAIVVPHGGPTGKTEDGFDREVAALASRGYIVIAPNFRGSTGYGKAFQLANYNDLGGGDLKDTIAAKKFLVDSGYVDPGRVGIFGGSYGGFMTLMAIGKAPDEFAAAVQLFGIINWRTMYRDMDEQLKAYLRSLMGTPEENPKGYDLASPLTYIRNAKAPLLTLQGENDIRVPRGQAQEVHDILTARGNVVETIYYPAEGHGFRKTENQLDSLRRTVEWFDKYLAPK